MARLNVYVPDELAARTEKPGLRRVGADPAAIAGALAAEQDGLVARHPCRRTAEWGHHRRRARRRSTVRADDFGVRG